MSMVEYPHRFPGGASAEVCLREASQSLVLFCARAPPARRLSSSARHPESRGLSKSPVKTNPAPLREQRCGLRTAEQWGCARRARMKRDRRGRYLSAGLARRLDRPAAGGRQRGGGLSRAAGRSGCCAAGEPDPMGEDSGVEPPPSWGGAADVEPGIGKPLTTGYCRLCHGKFSSRSLRNAFGKVPVIGEGSEKHRRVEQVFFADFQRLLGVTVLQDPTLPQFVCKNCHAQFYKCRSVLKTFLQRVNTSPTGRAKPKSRGSGIQSQLDTEEGPCMVDLITSSPQCLHRLVIWSHTHAGNCQSVPNMQPMLSSQYCGIIRTVWGCGAGHAYVMDTGSDCHTLLKDNALSAKWNPDKSTEPHLTGNGAGTDNSEAVSVPRTQQAPKLENVCQQLPDKEKTLQTVILENRTSCCRSSSHSQPNSIVSSPEKHPNSSSVQGQVSREQSSHSTTEEPMKVETSDISEGEDGNGEERHNQSMDESFSPCSDKSKVPNETSENAEAKKSEEPKEKKKPGPKPGWKNKFKPEREELPAIYKCPYQGCTAVYRGADGMKKHIKEHHEQVRERPCPHPGCNKVFMIDRYLQRHVKLIHTEERNYICDQCGQTFKQGKHLSVHQMRHSGAKPLQCEICGFQCRQRASLKYHMTKHKAEAELDFACDQCGKRFEKAHNLNVHMSMVHPLTQNHDKARLSETEQIISSTCILEDDSETCASQYVKSELTIQKDPS